MQFVDLLRKPDFVYGATEASDLRFEEKDNGVDCPVQYEYKVEKDSAKIIVYPSGNPVKYLKFRFCGDLSFVDKVYGDQYERQSFKAYLEWRSVTGEAGSGEEMTNAKAEDFYTRPDEAESFCKATGIDALAIAFGTAHGFYKSQPKLDFGVVEKCAASTGLPLVMHGGSGVSEEGFKKAIENGIRKINYYSYMSKAGYMAAKEVIASGKTSYLHDVEYAAMQAMKEDVKKAIKTFSNCN